MGNCCKPLAREEDCEENRMERVPMPNEGNSSIRVSRYGDLQAITSLPARARHIENEREQALYVFRGHHPGFGGIPKGSEAELVAAGWPSWMVKDAGEAFKGWIPRKEKSFQRLEKVYCFSLLIYIMFYGLFYINALLSLWMIMLCTDL